MSGYSEDLRRRIVSSVEGGMLKAQAARTFSVSLSSVKRYVNKAQRGEPLTPKKRPGSTPKLDEKAMKLLQDDLERVMNLGQGRRLPAAGKGKRRRQSATPPPSRAASRNPSLTAESAMPMRNRVPLPNASAIVRSRAW